MNPYAPPAARLEANAEAVAAAPLTVQFQNSFVDLLGFQLYLQARSPVLLVVLFGFSALGAHSLWSELDANYRTVTLFVFLTLVAAVLLALAQLSFILAWLLVHQDKSYRRRRTLELTEHAIFDTTDLTRSEIQWPAVHKVVRTSWCLYVCPTPMSAHCVPRRAFADSDAFARFSSLAVELSICAKRRAA